MKNIKTIGMLAARLCVVTLIVSMAVFSCSSGDSDPGEEGGDSLSGTIQILLGGQPVDYDVYTGTELTAEYSGDEAVTYQWKKGGVNVGADKGGTSATFTPGEAGTYTVTVSAPGKTSKTSAAVTVVGEAVPELPGDIEILIDDSPVTTAETGQTLTAWYDGQETVSYQWFKDEEPLTSYASVNFDTYTPTEAGSYTVKVNLLGYLPKISAPVIVSGETLITITFDLTGASGINPTIVIAPGEEITARGEALPGTPAYNGFTFVGWYTDRTGGTKVEDDHVFHEDTTVFARWNFAGGTPYVSGETLVHENPLVTAGTNFAGTISQTDGTISFTAGAFNYNFPIGEDFNTGDYQYLVVAFTLSSPTGNVSGVFLNQRGSSTRYQGISNAMPWLSNLTNSGITFPMFGSSDSGGFSIQYNGQNAEIVLRITKITYHKLPIHTVTFDLDGGTATGTLPSSLAVEDGYTIDQRWPNQFPAPPTLTDNTFIGWKNPEGAVVTATTPIMGDWTLTAQWMLTSEVPAPVDIVSNDGTLFAASGGSTAAKFSYDDKQWWVFAKTPPGTPAAVAPFDEAAANDYTAALAAAAAYTRVSYNLPTLSDMWSSFPKVTITYDLIVVGGSELTLTVRNGTGGGSDPNIAESQTVVAGTDKTLTFNTSAIGSGNLAFVKRNSGTDTLFLMRITKVELHLD